MITAPLLLLAALAAAPVQPSSPLTLAEAVRIAEANEPSLRSARADVRAAEARVDEARAPLLPQVAATAQVERSGAVRSRVSPENQWTAGLTAQQLVWDFGASSAGLAGARASAQAQVATARESRLSIDAQVRSAFAEAHATRALVAIAQETLANQRGQLEKVRAFVEVGSKPESDLAQARSQVAQAQLALVQAESRQALARARLHRALGLGGTPGYELAEESVPAVAGEDGPAEPLGASVDANRPAIQRAGLLVSSQERAVESARGGYLPSLGVFAGATARGARPTDLDGGWSAGLTLSWSLFDGGLTRARVREASATLESLRAGEETARQDAQLELAQVLSTIHGAKSAWEASAEAVSAAEEQLRLAAARYEAGAGTLLEVNDAQVAAASASSQGVEAELQLAQARAQLLALLGRDGA
jgi:outer membrane protein